jgi:hypothetical protein
VIKEIKEILDHKGLKGIKVIRDLKVMMDLPHRLIVMVIGR